MAQSEQHMALLKNKLQMPLVARDLMIANQRPSDDVKYALHEMMSNFQPEEALLCAAFVMKDIASMNTQSSDDMNFLHMECDRLIDRYAARDDLAQDNPDLWSETENDMIHVIGEDISDFLEIIFLCYMTFEITNAQMTDILDIITAQLQAQSVIVEEVIALQDSVRENAIADNTPHIETNVVIFPR